MAGDWEAECEIYGAQTGKQGTAHSAEVRGLYYGNKVTWKLNPQDRNTEKLIVGSKREYSCGRS